MGPAITVELGHDLASKSGWDIATVLNCGYQGDGSPIYHGGFFYDSRRWEREGIARAVEFWHDPEHVKARYDDPHDKRLMVQQGWIKAPRTEKEREECWDTSIPPGHADRSNIHAQIYTTRLACGIEPAGITFPHLMGFTLRTWPENRIWRKVAPWLVELGETPA